MTREEIIALLECPKEDAITHFNDDGDGVWYHIVTGDNT